MRGLLLFCISILFAACNESSRDIETVNVVATKKINGNLQIIYEIPETRNSWHCAGASIRQSVGRVDLQFLQAHDADDGFQVDLPSHALKRDGKLLHYVEFPYEPNSEFKLFVNGVYYSTMTLDVENGS